jgi:hypothetical protein
MKSWAVHYKNKYPGARVFASDDACDVYSADGEHLVAVRRAGHGGWVDVSEEMGCRDRHDLAPIPKEARIYKLQKNGCIGLDEKADARKAWSKGIEGDRVWSLDEIEKMNAEAESKKA